MRRIRKKKDRKVFEWNVGSKGLPKNEKRHNINRVNKRRNFSNRSINFFELPETEAKAANGGVPRFRHALRVIWAQLLWNEISSKWRMNVAENSFYDPSLILPSLKHNNNNRQSFFGRFYPIGQLADHLLASILNETSIRHHSQKISQRFWV